MQISDTFLKLSKLPPEQTEHPVRHLDRIMNEFEKNVTAALEPKSTAVHYVKMKMHDFAKEIEKLSPRLVVINDHEKEQEEAEKYNNQSGGLFGRNNRRMIEARAAREVTPTPNGGKGGEHGDAMDVDEPAPSTPAGRKRPMMETPKSNKKPRGGDATPSNSSSTPGKPRLLSFHPHLTFYHSRNQIHPPAPFSSHQALQPLAHVRIRGHLRPGIYLPRLYQPLGASSNIPAHLTS